MSDKRDDSTPSAARLGHVPPTAPIVARQPEETVPQQVVIQAVLPPPDFQGGYVPPAPPVIKQNPTQPRPKEGDD